jgi:hypothetical protein
MALLTDQILATGVSLNDLIHIVITGDTSQNPAGSSFKATIQQVAQVISGTTGTSGTSGSSGISGNDGTSGSSGISGNDGTSGSSGISGSSGNDGTSGSSGISGNDGTSGSSGINGNDGTSGSSGINGLNGTSGSSGISGNDGTSGSSGINGNDGTSGSSGISGNDGTSGSSGINGNDGTSGSSGSSGINGNDGTSGSSGISGTDGSSGISGIDGALSGRWIFDATYTPPAVPLVPAQYFYTDSATFSTMTEFVISNVGENSVDYYTLLYKMFNVSPNLAVTITDVTNNSILGSYNIASVVDNTTYFKFTLGTALATNGMLSSFSSYSISFSIWGGPGSNGTSGSSGTNGVAGSSGSSGSSGTSGGSAWGGFVSTVSQYVTSTTTAYSMSAATQTSGNGVIVSADTRFVVASAGTYNLQFSCQIESTGGGSAQTMDIWLAINGNNVANSNTQVVGNSNNGRSVAAWNFVEPLNAGDYMELKFSVSDVRLGFAYDGTQINPTRPAIPSVIVTVTQV